MLEIFYILIPTLHLQHGISPEIACVQLAFCLFANLIEKSPFVSLVLLVALLLSSIVVSIRIDLVVCMLPGGLAFEENKEEEPLSAFPSELFLWQHPSLDNILSVVEQKVFFFLNTKFMSEGVLPFTLAL